VPRSCECGHFVSEALIKAGFSMLIGMRYDGNHCEKDRPLFTKDLRRWFSENGKKHIEPPEGYSFCYQEKGDGGNGERHVVLLKTTDGETEPPNGAIDYADWPTREYYTIE